MLAVPGWGVLQRRFVERAEARLAGRQPPPFPFAATAPAAGARAWGRLARSLLRALFLRAPERQAEVLVFTLAAGGSASDRDAYFGSLAEWLGSERTTTVYLAAGAKTSLPGSAQRIPLEAFASANDVLAAWLEGRRATLASAPADPDHAALAKRLAQGEVAAGDAFAHALMRRAFANMLAALRPRVLVYPFENRAWEKSLVAAARVAGVARIVGYQHSSITPRHLAFEQGAGPLPPLPDCVLTVGAVTAQWLRERAPALADRIAVGASLRRATSPVPLPAGHGLLVAISSSRDEALALMQWLHAAAPMLRLPVVLRSHPTIPVADLFARFEWPDAVRLSAGTTLDQDLASATMVCYASSTVALEGMLHGRLPLFADIGDIPAADPLIGDCPAKAVATDGASLAAQVAAICRLDAPELERKRDAAKRYAEAYLRDPGENQVQGIVAAILKGKEAA